MSITELLRALSALETTLWHINDEYDTKGEAQVAAITLHQIATNIRAIGINNGD